MPDGSARDDGATAANAAGANAATDDAATSDGATAAHAVAAQDTGANAANDAAARDGVEGGDDAGARGGDVAAGARSWRIAGGLAMLGLVAAIGAAAARKLSDFDLPWHLALGRATIALRALPLVDDFSFTARGRHAPDELLADTLLYLCARTGGALGLQLLAAAALIALALLLVARARPAPRAVAVALAALALMAAGPWLVVRPALLSFVCLAAFALVLDRHRLARRPLWPLVPLQLVWSNVHGFAVLGPLLALAYAAYALACRTLARRAPPLAGAATLFPAADGEGAARTAAIALAVAAIACVGPLGPSLYSDPFVVVSHQPLITEWTRTSLGFVARHDLALLVLGLVLLAGLFAGPRPSAFELLLALVALALALMAVRMIALGAILAAPLAARRIAPLLTRARGAPALIATLGLLAAPVITATPGLRYGIGFDEGNLPEGAVRFIRDARPRGALWNFLPFGGWLTWRLYPDVRVFIDGRTGRLYPVPLFERYFAAEHDAAAFAALADEWNLQWAVVRARAGEAFSEPIARDGRWAMVYLDDCAAVYVRRDGPNAELAARGYQRLRHLTIPPPGALPPELAVGLRHDAALALAQDPSSPRARAFAVAAGLVAE